MVSYLQDLHYIQKLPLVIHKLDFYKLSILEVVHNINSITQLTLGMCISVSSPYCMDMSTIISTLLMDSSSVMSSGIKLTKLYSSICWIMGEAEGSVQHF